MKNITENETILPAGQQARPDFPRFGIPAFAKFQAPVTTPYTLTIAGDIPAIKLCPEDLIHLERVELAADFHCVATWSYRGVSWSGFRFREVFEQLVRPQLPPNIDLKLAVFGGLDGYRASLLLEDALANDMLLADTLNGEPLTNNHGSPLRLVAPAHYGYKNVKHLAKIDLWCNVHSYRPILPKFMEHPRGRVVYEERGRYLPGWLLRYVYRPLIQPIVRHFERVEADNAT
ncbi:MAG: molybdopterin-dependent oxidoreductase [Chloroflexota bacterium]